MATKKTQKPATAKKKAAGATGKKTVKKTAGAVTKTTKKKAASAKKATAGTATKKKIAPRRAPAKKAAQKMSPEERHMMIAVHAYFKAENRGFGTGAEMIDWLEAEREIDDLLGGKS